jgi:chitinase
LSNLATYGSRIAAGRMTVSLLLVTVFAGFVLTGWHATTRSRPATYRVVGYFGDWHKGCKSWACGSITQVRFADLTDFIYAFASSAGDSCALTDARADARIDFPVIRRMKRRYHRLHVLLSLGGGSAGNSFAAAVSSPARVNRLVHNCVTLMRRTYPGVFDGIDIDWEFPSNTVERGSFTRLVKAFRQALGRGATLTMAAGTDSGMVRWIDWKVVSPQLSWINLMTYDFHGPWGDPVTNFNAPLMGDRKDPGFHQGYWTANAVSTMRKHLHIPPSQIMVGIPFYGRGYAQVPAKNHGLYQKYRGATPYGTDAPGVFNYRDIVARYINRNGFRRYGPNSASAEPWLYSSKRHAFIGYDDISTMAAKAAYIKRTGLGGAMIWDLAFDTANPRTSLTDALHRYLAAK